MRRVAIAMLAGAVLFSILTTWLAPKMIGWYVSPADQPAAMSCQAAVVGAMHRLVQMQLVGTILGALIGLVLGIVMRPKRQPPPVAPPPTKVA